MRIECKHCGKEVVQEVVQFPMIEIKGNWICQECISNRKPNDQYTDPTFRPGTVMTWKLCIPGQKKSGTDE